MVVRALAFVAAVVVALAFAPVAEGAEPGAPPTLAEVAKLRRDGQYDAAIAKAREGLAAAEKASGPHSAEVGRWLDQLANTLDKAGRYEEAEAAYKRQIAVFEKALGAGAAEVGSALADLGGLYVDQGRLAEAEATLKRAIGIVEAARGPDHHDTADVLNTLALLYVEQGRLREAEPMLLRVLASDEKGLGPEHQDTATSLANLAELYRHMGRFAQAETLIKRALAIDEKHYGADSLQAAWDLSNLGELYQLQERFQESELAFRRSLDIRERKLGDHYDTAFTLASFADLMIVQGRYGEAEPLLLRALAINMKAPGAQHPDTAQTLQSLAALYFAQGRKASAREHYARALGIIEKVLGADHQLTAQALANVASIDVDGGRFAEAETALVRAMRIHEATLEPDDFRTIRLRGQLATVHLRQGRLAQAEAGLRAQLAALERAMPADYPATGMAQYWLARVLLAQGKHDEAVTRSRRAGEIIAARKSRSLAQRLSGGASETAARDEVFALEVRAAFAAAQARPAEAAALRDAAFAAAQRATFDETGRAVAHMASRAAAGSDALAALLREQQDLLRQLSSLDQRLANAIGASDPAARAQAAPLRLEAADIGARLRSIDARLRRDHPAYVALSDPKPLTVAEVQALLQDDEAAVLPFVLEDQTILFAVTKTTAVWAGTAATAASLGKDVAALRAELDPVAWIGSFAPFDRALSYRVYRSVWQPIEAALEGKRNVFVVPTGPLTSLPLAVLVTAAPGGGKVGDGDPQVLREAPWLVKRHALVTLPGLSSLKALRLYAAKGSASEPFAGFGDPSLRNSGDERQARSVGSVYRGVAPDLNALKSLASLPHTAVELRALAKSLGAGDADLFLRERATETQVKSLDLSRKRVIAFATHGLVAGEFGFGEPGLVLTPPSAGSSTDDGYLAASEAARLNLRADWVILSACNTAAGDAPGAKGLSGLARAFFLAGAKSILVSHWQVWDDVASRMSTTAVQNFQANASAGRGEALRQAMLAVMADTDEARFAHPAAWGAFILAGETRAN